MGCTERGEGQVGPELSVEQGRFGAIQFFKNKKRITFMKCLVAEEYVANDTLQGFQNYGWQGPFHHRS
jgi:hypothetical protein